MKYAKMEKKEHKKGKDKEIKKDMMMEMNGMGEEKMKKAIIKMYKR